MAEQPFGIDFGGTGIKGAPVDLESGAFAAVEEHDLNLDSRVHVRNQFHSVVDGIPYRIDSSRDADSEVHAAVGKTMKLRTLARHMIVTSSNLATNLLIDAVGHDYHVIRASVEG